MDATPGGGPTRGPASPGVVVPRVPEIEPRFQAISPSTPATIAPNWMLYPTKPPNVKLDRLPENPNGVSAQPGGRPSPVVGQSTAPGSTKFIGIVLAPPNAPYCGPFQLGGGGCCVRVATR